MTQAIYKIVSRKTGQTYIGSSVNTERRFNEHVSKLKLGKHDNKNLQSHFNKFGLDDLEFEILVESDDTKTLRKIEFEQIKKIKIKGSDTLFNVIGVRWVGDKKKKEVKIIKTRNDLIWALVAQGYNGSQIALIFNLHRSTVHDVIKQMPEGYVSPWRKVK